MNWISRISNPQGWVVCPLHHSGSSILDWKIKQICYQTLQTFYLVIWRQTPFWQQQFSDCQEPSLNKEAVNYIKSFSKIAFSIAAVQHIADLFVFLGCIRRHPAAFLIETLVVWLEAVLFLFGGYYDRPRASDEKPYEPWHVIFNNVAFWRV